MTFIYSKLEYKFPLLLPKNNCHLGMWPACESTYVSLTTHVSLRNYNIYVLVCMYNIYNIMERLYEVNP
jgi:hypothetical protein